ncbi:alpha/beta fold hydrolase [Trinickia caryophylli]|uniref:Surfactin synthase thioesterase subunit n=1 Tax=Trinickia caryophylli TaxID=28094 RepID=A0A1X7GAN7_TRICW|nr:alpha/beta fold hydrolase [Trinickia caryophylli]PMS11339.1 thioesterase [Trinickia caryophylli]TRX17529.1 thioesterase [Trinickia caryophylli]WQE11722.1 alpha/beta fold hydrolase [Trinickia caryophylli]SMF66821.1 Surfactin synthase thioesterase subunit [Trinickia caryophylli]GLU34909.1 thioesterase [Trinickia caryophylli]
MPAATQSCAAGPVVKLVCLAHAGGSAALYRDWPRRLPSFVEVHALDLPGHGAKHARPLLADWPALVGAVADEVAGIVGARRPFAIFGHSMGALVGLELAHALRLRGCADPVWFGASGTVSPARRAVETGWLACARDVLVERLRQRGGTPAVLLDDHEFIDFMLPVLRADFHLCGVHPMHLAMRVASGFRPLDCPIDVFIGHDDPATGHAADVEAWSAETLADCAIRRFEGGHFFVADAPEAVLAAVSASLQAMLVPRGHGAGDACQSFAGERS